jgi:hypothetical protein
MLQNPLSTIAGLLSVVMVAGVYFSTVPATMVNQKVAVWGTLASGLARVLLGLIQKDPK